MAYCTKLAFILELNKPIITYLGSLLVGDLLPERGELLSLLLLDVKTFFGGLLLVERVAGSSTAGAGSAGVTGSHALSDGRERAGGPRGGGARDGAGRDAERHFD
jgi:hypothetical protein